MRLGLAGGYCAGKNAAASLLEGMGWSCVDVDRLGHEAIELARDQIVARFGSSVLGADGRVDRRALAAIVFSDPRALADQEAIVHPIAIRLTDERVAAAEEAARAEGREAQVCVHAALLHRGDLVGRLDAVIEVRAPLVVRLLRGMRRDSSGLPETWRRITRQRGFRAALRRAAREAGAPIVVLRNAGGRAALERSLEAALARALGQATRGQGRARRGQLGDGAPRPAP